MFPDTLMLGMEIRVKVSQSCVSVLSHFRYTGCYKIYYAFSTGHNRSDTGPILKIYEFLLKLQLDASIFHTIFSFLPIHAAIIECLKI